MSLPEKIKLLAGRWEGNNQLWLSANDPVKESRSTAVISFKANEKFIAIEYTWSDKNIPQEGVIIVGCDPKSQKAKAAWIDSWHNGDTLMPCDGSYENNGMISVKGTYSAPGTPDWGWRISIEPNNENSFRLIMHNIYPDGKEELAVEVQYNRIK